MRRNDGDLVFVGDVHLDRGDPYLKRFIGMLEGLADGTRTLVLAGDLFNLWIGREEMEQPHQTAVLRCLRVLRTSGIRVRYLEGNRDYRVGACYSGDCLDDASEDGILEEAGGRKIFAIHGDLVNLHDRKYRRWRRLSRSAAVWAVFNMLPTGLRLRTAEMIERHLRSSNVEYKSGFPEAEVRRYAASLLASECDTVVLGHFHLERDLQAEPPSPPGRILVLPDWKSSRRLLRISRDGEIGFEER